MTRMNVNSTLELEPIVKRSFSDPDRAELQDRIAGAVERDGVSFLEKYVRDPRTQGGRYINSDLIKETFAEYAVSAATRNQYNSAVHNAAAVLASAQYSRVVRDGEPKRQVAVFITGTPGAGKTTAVLQAGALEEDHRLIYEGQLSNASQAIAKLQQAREVGLQVVIVVVHIQPERALDNTLGRFLKIGRGATIEAMASIQGHLPSSLECIRGQFGEAIELLILDKREGRVRILTGWEHWSELQSEGTYEQIRQRLGAELERRREAGAITDAAYRQARG